MRVDPKAPVAEMAGRTGKGPVIFFTRGGRTFARAYVKPRDPKSATQMAVRSLWPAAQRAWSRALTAGERRGWETYAREVLGQDEAGAGYRAFVQAQIFGIGPAGRVPRDGDEPVRKTAPVRPPPGAPVEVELDADATAAAPADSLVMRVRVPETAGHGTGGGGGAGAELWLHVKATAPTGSAGRKPRPCELAWACGVGPESFVPLRPDASGVATAQIRDLRFPLPAGARLGVEVRLVSGEGAAGPPVARDFVRQDAAPGGDPVETAAAQRPERPASTLALKAPFLWLDERPRRGTDGAARPVLFTREQLMPVRVIPRDGRRRNRPG